MKKYGASQFIDNVEKKRRASDIAPSQPRVNLRLRKRTATASAKSKTEKQQTVVQALLYVGALLLTFLFAFIWNIVHRYWVIYLLEMTFIPLLGMFNFLIFIRPRIVMIRQCKPELSYFKTFVTAITSKEITLGRRASISGNIRRSSQLAFGRRSSTTRSSMISSDIIAAAQTVQAEELKEDVKAARLKEQRLVSRKSLQTPVLREDRCNLSTDIIAAAPIVQAKHTEGGERHVSSDIISDAQVLQAADVKGNDKVNEKASDIHDLEFGLMEKEADSLDDNNGLLRKDGSDQLFIISPRANELDHVPLGAIEDTDDDHLPGTMEDSNDEAFNLTQDYHNMI